MSVYVVVDIGCLECGESSDVRVFGEQAAAEAWLRVAEKAQRDDWHGQHAFELYRAEIDGPATYIPLPEAEEEAA